MRVIRAGRVNMVIKFIRVVRVIRFIRKECLFRLLTVFVGAMQLQPNTIHALSKNINALLRDDIASNGA
jgi:hypothetical protein